MSHFLFASHFCLVRRPNEKGHVERLVEYARSNFLVPVPRVDSLAELNARLTAQCQRDQERTTRGKPGTVATRLVEDRAAMLPIPVKRFEPRRVTEVAADSLSLVRFDTNSYSVPTKYAHRTLTVIGTLEDVRVVFEDRLIARHQRCWEREQFRFDPVHYLALLERKPGGFDFAQPLETLGSARVFGRIAAGSKPPMVRARPRSSSVCCGCWNLLAAPIHRRRESALDIDVLDPDSIRRDPGPPPGRPVPVLARRSTPSGGSGGDHRRGGVPALLDGVTL